MTFLLVSTLILTLLAPWLVSLFVDDFPPDAQRLATIFAAICLPQVFFYGLYTLLGQILNAHGRFLPYLWAPVLANLVAIAGLVWFKVAGYPLQAPVSQWSTPMILTLAGSATLSILVQAVCLVIPLRRIGFRFRPVWGIRGVGLATTSRIALWTMAGVAVSQAGFAVTSTALTRAANFGTETGAAVPSRGTFDYAFLLFMLPHSLITVSLVTALFTRMAGSVSDGDADGVRRDYRSAILPLPRCSSRPAPSSQPSPRSSPAPCTSATPSPRPGSSPSWSPGWSSGYSPMAGSISTTAPSSCTTTARPRSSTPVTGTAVSLRRGRPTRPARAHRCARRDRSDHGIRHRRPGRDGPAPASPRPPGHRTPALHLCPDRGPGRGMPQLPAWVVGRLLPGLGETSRDGGHALRWSRAHPGRGRALALTWFSAHLLGVREIGDAAASIAARVRRRAPRAPRMRCPARRRGRRPLVVKEIV